MSVLIVEDEYEFQNNLLCALEQIFEKLRVHTTSRGTDAVAFSRQFSGALDIALIDLGLPDMNGVTVIKEIKKDFPNTTVLVVTSQFTKKILLESLLAGANGYIMKDATPPELAISINHALKGNTPVSPIVVKEIIDEFVEKEQALYDPRDRLSCREIELLQLLASGLSYINCAKEMGLQLSTVHSYSKKLFRKLRVNSKSQAILEAQKFGIRGVRKI